MRLRMVVTGTVVIVEPDPTIASVWVEVAAYAGFAAEVVRRVPDLDAGSDVHAVILKLSPDGRQVAREWKAAPRPRLIALAEDDDVANPDLKDFDVVLPRDGQVRALYAELHRLFATA
jgi:hypothetical protein